jgi:hypothetical protein
VHVERLRALGVLLVVTVTAASGPAGDAGAQRRPPAAPEVTGYEIDNERCFDPFMGPDATGQIPRGGIMSSGPRENTTLAIEEPSPRGRRTLEAWIATGPTPGRRFIVSPMKNDAGRVVGFFATCVVARALIAPSEITLGAAQPTTPPSAWIRRSVQLSVAAKERVNDSLAHRIGFFEPRGDFAGAWTVGALLDPSVDVTLDFTR